MDMGSYGMVTEKSDKWELPNKRYRVILADPIVIDESNKNNFTDD